MHSITTLAYTLALLSIWTVTADEHPNVWDIVSNDERLSILAAALRLAGLEEASKAPGGGTIFAPSDAAFTQLPSDVVAYYSDENNRAALVGLLLYHVVDNSTLSAAEIADLDLPTTLETLNGGSLVISKQDESITVNNATVIAADVKCSNGIIHIIDQVLIPSARK